LLGTKGDPSSWTITVKKTDLTNPSEISGVQFRRVKSADYLEKDLEINQSNGLYFQKTNGSEFTALVIKNGKLIIIAMTVNTNDKTKENEFLNFIKTININ